LYNTVPSLFHPSHSLRAVILRIPRFALRKGTCCLAPHFTLLHRTYLIAHHYHSARITLLPLHRPPPHSLTHSLIPPLVATLPSSAPPSSREFHPRPTPPTLPSWYTFGIVHPPTAPHKKNWTPCAGTVRSLRCISHPWGRAHPALAPLASIAHLAFTQHVTCLLPLLGFPHCIHRVRATQCVRCPAPRPAPAPYLGHRSCPCPVTPTACMPVRLLLQPSRWIVIVHVRYLCYRIVAYARIRAIHRVSAVSCRVLIEKRIHSVFLMIASRGVREPGWNWGCGCGFGFWPGAPPAE